ncbi:MAG: hypothetical protein A2Y41_05150 [Spirochaetes bacterium GWB1_36_13]|nr:MAG: hypothetical protein A2Y41_05150 [Spirochaetes bacterium GWB1_36_13]
MAEELNDEESKEEGGISEQPSGGFLSKGIVKILMIVASFLVGVILMVLVSNIVFNIREKGSQKEEEVIWSPGVTPKKPAYQTLGLDPFKINLNDPTGTMPGILQLEIALAYEKNNVKLQTELLDRKLQIRDKIITLLSSKTYEDLNTPDKIADLKKQIKNQINTLLMEGIIEEIYVSSFDVITRT